MDGHEQEQGGQCVRRLEVVFGLNQIAKGGPKHDYIVYVHVMDVHAPLEAS